MANLSNINGKFVVEQTTGYVGVGTTDPNYPIEVLNASAEIALNASGGSIYRVQSDSASNFIIRKAGVGDRLVINSAGNATFGGQVSVGNYAIPSDHQFQIAHLGQSYARFALTNSQTGNGSSDGLIFQMENLNSIIKNQENGTLGFGTNGRETDILINSSGKVGIGTTSPLAQLTIGSGSLTDGNIPVQISTSGGTSQVWYGVNKNGGYGLLLGRHEGGIGGGGAGSYIRNIPEDPLYFMVSNTGLAMTILPNENIGIGTASPTNGKLEVQQTATTAALRVQTGGTTDAYSIADFRTGTNASALAIKGNGNVGIGTTSPGSKLHVVDGNNYAKLGDLHSNSTMSLRMADNSGFPVEVQAYGTELRFNTATTTGATPSVKMNILPNGNVGIGTTSPYAQLHVSHSLGNGGIMLGNTATTGSKEMLLNIHPLGLIWQRWVNGAYQANLMTLDYDGNLGIGTTSPLALLSVGSGSLADANVPVQISTSGGTSQRWFGVNKDGNYGLLMGYLNGGSIGDGGAGAYIRNITEDPLYFMVSNSDLAMTILANKNVGIGTTTPIGKLTVQGDDAHIFLRSNDYTIARMIIL